jgi:hypothetical protein
MAGDFIPLFPGAKTSVRGGASQTFSPVVSSSPPGPSPTAFVNAPHAAAGQAHREVNIEIKRDGERISQIRIQCRCGELIELDCEY